MINPDTSPGSKESTQSTKDYVEACSEYLTLFDHRPWDFSRQTREVQQLREFVQGRGTTEGIEPRFPLLNPLRWAQIGKDLVALLNFLDKRGYPLPVINETRREAMGRRILPKDPNATLVAVGAGFELIRRELFGSNVVLVDPAYQLRPSPVLKEYGYRSFAVPFSRSVLDSLPAVSLCVEVNNSLHHFDSPEDALHDMFSDSRVAAISISDYALPELPDHTDFVLRELETLFPSFAERNEFRDIGIADFLRLHTRQLLKVIEKLSQQYGFSGDLSFFPNADANKDDLTDLTGEEQQVFIKGTKFATTLFRK